jgi:hypothetical protein
MSDIFAALRQGWIYLVVYYIVAVAITFFVWRVFRLSRFLRSRKSRLILAGVLAVVFTPSVISDFFLLMIPGPAVVGLLLILPASVHDPVFLWVALVYYIIPLFIVFCIIRFLFWACERHETSPRQIV